MSKQVEVSELDFTKVIDTNELYPHYCGTDEPIGYCSYKLTDGIFDIAEETDSRWLLNLIISHQDKKLKGEEFQSWTFEREMEVENDGEVASRTNVFNLTCDDGNGNKLRRQKIPFSSFDYDTYTIWLIQDTFLLPKEY